MSRNRACLVHKSLTALNQFKTIGKKKKVLNVNVLVEKAEEKEGRRKLKKSLVNREVSNSMMSRGQGSRRCTQEKDEQVE
jgi:hypothetical protein